MARSRTKNRETTSSSSTQQPSPDSDDDFEQTSQIEVHHVNRQKKNKKLDTDDVESVEFGPAKGVVKSPKPAAKKEAAPKKRNPKRAREEDPDAEPDEKKGASPKKKSRKPVHNEEDEDEEDSDPEDGEKKEPVKYRRVTKASSAQNAHILLQQLKTQKVAHLEMENENLKAELVRVKEAKENFQEQNKDISRKLHELSRKLKVKYDSIEGLAPELKKSATQDFLTIAELGDQIVLLRNKLLSRQDAEAERNRQLEQTWRNKLEDAVRANAKSPRAAGSGGGVDPIEKQMLIEKYNNCLKTVQEKDKSIEALEARLKMFEAMEDENVSDHENDALLQSVAYAEREVQLEERVHNLELALFRERKLVEERDKKMNAMQEAFQKEMDEACKDGAFLRMDIYRAHEKEMKKLEKEKDAEIALFKSEAQRLQEIIEVVRSGNQDVLKDAGSLYDVL